MHLLTGATGYIGGRLLSRLEADGEAVRCLCRNPEAVAWRVASVTEVVEANLLSLPSLRSAFIGVDTAFYLVHAMFDGGDFEVADREAATNFALAAREANVRRIIYLGGLAHGQDLSPHMLDVVTKVAAHHNVTLETKVASAEDLSDFADDSFDYVFGANVLHHVDMAQCLDEVKRVLKPGGIGAFWDPVDYNPVINVYRRMADHVRTEDEHPMRMDDMKKFSTRFPFMQKRFFWLTALAVFLKFYLIDRVHPNQARYWKRVVAQGQQLKRLYTPLAKIDGVLLRVFPFLGWLGWTVAVVVKK